MENKRNYILNIWKIFPVVDKTVQNSKALAI